MTDQELKEHCERLMILRDKKRFAYDTSPTVEEREKLAKQITALTNRINELKESY